MDRPSSSSSAASTSRRPPPRRWRASSASRRGPSSICSALAERDARIDAVVLRIQPSRSAGQGRRAARCDRAAPRERKQTIALLEVQNFSANKELYVGSAADDPFRAGAAVPLVGMAAEYAPLGGFWEMLAST
ncbi:MAG: hypothetical protein R3F21_09770 [Myxococcota bacterium]